MENSRLIKALQGLSSSDWKRFRQFVASPYFNTREDLRDFLTYLEECLLDLKLIPSKKHAFHKIYPKQTYTPQKIRQLMSLLLELLEKYFACENFLDQDFDLGIRSVQGYYQRGLTQHFEKRLERLEKKNEQQPFRNAEYFDSNFAIQLEYYRLTSKGKRQLAQNLQEILDQLDLAFISKKLRHACYALSHQAVYKTDYQFGLLEGLLQYIQTEKLLQYPSISTYYFGYLTYAQSENPLNFTAFKEKILKHGELFPLEEVQQLYLLAINYCIRKLNEGIQTYANEGLELYKAGLESGILLASGEISRFTYRNIVAMGLVAKEHHWIETFIHQYRPSLEKDYRVSMFSFCLARLEYERKQYSRVLELLQKAEYKDLLITLAIKTLLLKTYYELGEEYSLDAHLDAMQNFIRRKKVLGYHRTNYLNIIRYTKKLMALNRYDKSAIQALITQISQEEQLTERAWLLSKLT